MASINESLYINVPISTLCISKSVDFWYMLSLMNILILLKYFISFFVWEKFWYWSIIWLFSIVWIFNILFQKCINLNFFQFFLPSFMLIPTLVIHYTPILNPIDSLAQHFFQYYHHHMLVPFLLLLAMHKSKVK